MEDGTVVNIRNPALVAKLVSAIDLMVSLAHGQNPSGLFGLVLIWSLVSDLLAEVKTASLGRTNGTGAFSHGCDNVMIKSWYDICVFLCRYSAMIEFVCTNNFLASKGLSSGAWILRQGLNH